MVAEKKKLDFTSGRIFYKLVLFILPIIATNLLQTFYNAADMMVVSLSHEDNAVGAIGVTGSFINLIVNIFIGFSMGGNVIVSRWIGAKDKERTSLAVHTAVCMALLFGVGGMIVGLGLAPFVLKTMGATGNLLELAITYTDIYFFGVPFLAMTNYLIAIFRAKGDSKTPLIVLSLAGLLNVGLNFFFVLVVGLSVEGVALATSISNLVSSSVLLFILSRDKEESTRFSFKRLKIHKKSFREIIRIGVPAAIQGALISLSNIMIQSSIVRVNNQLCPPTPENQYQPVVNGGAAQGNLNNFIYTAMNAVYQGVITFVSQNIGANKPQRIRKIMFQSILLVSIAGLSVSGVIYIFKEQLLGMYGVFKEDTYAWYAANVSLQYVALPYFLCGIMEVGSGVLRGMGKSFVSMMINLIGMVAVRILWLATAFQMNPILEMVYVSYPITWVISITVEFILVHILLNKLIKEKSYEQ